jgi:hypothetical protein
MFPGKGSAIAMRMGDNYVQSAQYFAMMNGDDKTSRALRSNVLNCVLQLGGLTASWSKKYVVVADHGEYGQKNYVHDYRWALEVKVAKRASEDSGIKRRKLTA